MLILRSYSEDEIILEEVSGKIVKSKTEGENIKIKINSSSETLKILGNYIQ